MNATISAAVASQHQHELLSEAAEYRRSRKNSTRRHRVSRFLKDLAAASL